MIMVLAMNSCICCSHTLLKHIRGNQIHWFCRNCWQSMPVFLEENISNQNLQTLNRNKCFQSNR